MNEKKCFGCSAKNPKNQFGEYIYCNKCIQTFYSMADFIEKEIEIFKKLPENKKKEILMQNDITLQDMYRFTNDNTELRVQIAQEVEQQIKNDIIAKIAKKYEDISYTDYDYGFNKGLSFSMDIILGNNSEDIIKDIMGASD
jgi:hypothetical protein